MNDSILDNVKKQIGLPPLCEDYDIDIITDINSVFSILWELHCGPEDGFAIEDNSVKWSDYLLNEKRLNLVKTYMYKKVKLMFDPPQNSALLSALMQEINEYEFRILSKTDF